MTTTPARPAGTARARLLWLLLLVGALWLGPARLVVRESITDFMPRDDRSRALTLASELAESTLARGLVLCIRHPSDLPAAVDLARALEHALAGHPEVAWLSGGIEADQLETLHALYFPRRHYFVSDRPEGDVPGLVEDEALRVRARSLRQTLASPLPSLEAQLAGSDPLGLFAAIVARLEALGPALRTEGDRFVASDPAESGSASWAVVFLETRGSPFDSSRQGPLQETIAREFERLSHERGGGFVLEQGGTHRIAVATERAMRRDMAQVSALSLLGIPALLLLFFGSLRRALLVVAPVFFGLAVAVAFGMRAFGSLHVVTLAFGASLVGIAVDYSIHLVNHHALAPSPEAATTTARRLRPALLLGAATTLAGFAGFVLTSFAGVREMGIFAVGGVAASVTATLFGVPAFLPRGARAPRLQRAAADALGRWGAPGRSAAAVWWAPALCVVICGAGLPLLLWNDDPSALTAVDPTLLAEEERVRRRVSPMEVTRLVVARAPDRATAIARQERIRERIEPLIADGRLAGARSIHALLWSPELQRRNLAALRADATVPDRLERAFESEGFRPGAFEAWRRDLREPPAPPLRFEDLAGTSLERLARPLLVEHGDEVWSVAYLRGVSAPADVAAAVSDLEGVWFFDGEGLQAGLFSGYRRDALRLVLLGTGLVFSALWLRTRSPRRALASLLPALLAIPTALAIPGLLGIPVNLLGAVSLVLVLGLGVDYGVFVVDGVERGGSLGPTLLSLLLSGLTTLFAFGVLALSIHPALRAIGLVTGLGVLAAFACAPAAAALARPR